MAVKARPSRWLGSALSGLTAKPFVWDCDAFGTGAPHFDGADYVPERDHARLTGQIERVYQVLAEGGWLTVDAIAAMTGDPVCSVSAQIRNLRKKANGSHDVRRRRAGSIYEYRLFVEKVEG